MHASILLHLPLCGLTWARLLSFLFKFLTAILHHGLRNCFFPRSFTFHILFGLLYPFSIWTFFPFLFGLIFPFSFWTFISLFYLDFYFETFRDISRHFKTFQDISRHLQTFRSFFVLSNRGLILDFFHIFDLKTPKLQKDILKSTHL